MCCCNSAAVVTLVAVSTCTIGTINSMLKAAVLLVIYMKGSMKEPNMFHNYETEKITRKASDAAENLQL